MDRILIVDDEFLIRYTLEEGLKDRGYDAYSAATVEEGLEFVRKYHPGVLLLDNLLENSVGMDGIVNFKNPDDIKCVNTLSPDFAGFVMFFEKSQVCLR